jgi:GMP synthase (glutamine-hydrolysing)
LDARAATPTRLSFDTLQRIADEIIRDVAAVVSVTYNITPKPPSTVEAV